MTVAYINPYAVVVALVLAIYLRSIVKWRSRSGGRPLPPGPRPLPIIGNMFEIPMFKPWTGYRELSAKYGDIISFRVFGDHMVVLNSAETIMDFLEKRSANTSDRQQTPMIDITGQDFSLAFMPYGQRWRKHRRTFWQHFNPTASAKYTSIYRATTHRFLLRLLKDPAQFKDHLRYAFTATIMKVLYNNELDEDIDMQGHMVEVLQAGLAEGLTPGKFLAQFIPFVQHFPAWCLGPDLRRKSEKWRAACKYVKNVQFDKVKAAMSDSNGRDSVVGALLSKLVTLDVDPNVVDEEEDVIKNTVAISVEGGSDTSQSTLQSTLLALSLYPEVLKKAQAELDSVVGPHRLPDFDDRDSLVYVNALVKEALRWQNVGPLSAPHTTVSDDVLNGYFMPAGTVVVPNTWACMHDPEAYGDPDVFRPERFIKDGKLDPTVRDPYAFAFGYGRRICPGRYFADYTLFMNIASMLHVFDIGPPLDEHGRPIIITPEMSDGIVSHPEDCRCTIKPRSSQAEALILQSAAE